MHKKKKTTIRTSKTKSAFYLSILLDFVRRESRVKKIKYINSGFLSYFLHGNFDEKNLFAIYGRIKIMSCTSQLWLNVNCSLKVICREIFHDILQFTFTQLKTKSEL